MSPIGVVLLLVVVAIVGFAVVSYRRSQARSAAQAVGGTVGGAPSSAYVPPPTGGVGAPNPALPPPSSWDHRTGILTSGPPVEMRVCGLPALIWQRTEMWDNHWQPMQLHLIVDTAVGLPFLQLYRRGAVRRALQTAPVATGIAALDENFDASGDLDAWRQVLAVPGVVQALLSFPVHSVDVFGGRIALESTDGVHLDPGTAQGIASVAAALVSAVPPHLTSGAAQPPLTALAGAHVGDPDGLVREVLARQNLDPQQQDALLALVRATRARGGR